MTTRLLVLCLLFAVLLPSCSTNPTQCDTIAQVSAETARFICNLVGTINSQTASRAALTPQGRADLMDKITAVQSYLTAQAETSHQLGDYFQRAGDPTNANWQIQRAELLLQLHDQLQAAKDQLR